jgi:hypothetical protein
VHGGSRLMERDAAKPLAEQFPSVSVRPYDELVPAVMASEAAVGDTVGDKRGVAARLQLVGEGGRANHQAHLNSTAAGQVSSERRKPCWKRDGGSGSGRRHSEAAEGS